MDDTAPFFPIGADFFGIVGNFEAVADRERGAGFFNHLFRLVEPVDGERDDIGVLPFKFFDM